MRKFGIDQDAVARCAVVAPHPDDEAVGAAALIAQLTEPSIVFVTDGSPRNLSDARAAGFATREQYADARRKESLRALSLLGVKEQQVFQFGFVDQESSHHLREIAERVLGFFTRVEPRVVFTVPYEGGHPDHDSTAFGIHAACRILEVQGRRPPQLFEYTSYHDHSGAMAVFEFLNHHDGEFAEVVLSDAERDLKRRVVSSFVTQQRTLHYFPIELERFRPAPKYLFTLPPHPGTLYYERFEWGMDGPTWRGLAREALRGLGLAEPL